MYTGNKEIIGTCGSCGGPVTTYKVLMMVGPWPLPSCEWCGKVPKGFRPPVMPMEDNWRHTGDIRYPNFPNTWTQGRW